MTPNGIENCITKIIEEVEVVCAKERYIKGYRPRTHQKAVNDDKFKVIIFHTFES